MSESNALGHMGLMFGLLGLLLMVYGMARNFGPQYSADGPFFWAIITWGIGLVFVIGERFETSRVR